MLFDQPGIRLVGMEWTVCCLILGFLGTIFTTGNFDFAIHPSEPLLEPYDQHSGVQSEDVNFKELREYLAHRESRSFPSAGLRGQADHPVANERPGADILTEPLKADTKYLMEAPGVCSLELLSSEGYSGSQVMVFQDGLTSKHSITPESLENNFVTGIRDTYTPENLDQLSPCKVMDELIGCNLDDYLDLMETGALLQSTYEAVKGQF
ncbi:hypothetical protein PGTUg99_013877 [Puccinia graminis f. sp. tritici]|uniref:Uncharacterized protein n=1 Tax=Puccinia graminis f. sp. tritici TaxID=56615 RepID=A0A5B0R511_PUCGR|nr:hypothetical protein PGTUg99_013877 [Puccinia graminis f. sp. tritici]